MSDDSIWTLPARYVVEDFSGRDVIRCKTCGMRWYADRMTHWANQVFMTEHSERHTLTRRQAPKQLPRRKPAGPTREQAET